MAGEALICLKVFQTLLILSMQRLVFDGLKVKSNYFDVLSLHFFQQTGNFFSHLSVFTMDNSVLLNFLLSIALLC